MMDYHSCCAIFLFCLRDDPMNHGGMMLIFNLGSIDTMG